MSLIKGANNFGEIAKSLRTCNHLCVKGRRHHRNPFGAPITAQTNHTHPNYFQTVHPKLICSSDVLDGTVLRFPLTRIEPVFAFPGLTVLQRLEPVVVQKNKLLKCTSTEKTYQSIFLHSSFVGSFVTLELIVIPDFALIFEIIQEFMLRG